jgi:hypothetical protein
MKQFYLYFKTLFFSLFIIGYSALTVAQQSTTSGEPFSIIVLPDAQNYTSYLFGGSPSTFTAQTQWCVNSQISRNIMYVGMVGDLTNESMVWEWENADDAMSILDAVAPGIPFGVVPGNHDLIFGTSTFNSYFGVSRFQSRSYYGGHYGTTNENHYDFFSSGSMDFIVICLGAGDQIPGSAVLDWADALLKSNLTKRGILINHSLMYPGIQGSFTNPGQAIYDALKDNPNLFMMVCGHEFGSGYRTDTYSGHTIYTMIADYQNESNGGNGWLRIAEFDPPNNLIHMTTYSPTLNSWKTGVNDKFDLYYDMQSITPPLPIVFNVSGSWSYCQGTGGLPVELSGSESGVTYTLYKGGIAQSPTVAGTGNPITFSNQTAGNYTVSGTNGNGTSIMQGSAVITENPTPAVPTVTLTQPACGSTTGTIAVTSPTGTGMTYSINGSTYTNTSGTFTGVTVGTYNVTAKNASGCTSPATSVTLNTNPLPAAPTVILTQPACGLTTGTIAVTSPTGTGMTFSINGSTYTNTSGTFTGVTVGTYNVTAKNASGCTSPATSVTLNANPLPAVPTVTLTQPTCGSTTGTIAVTSPTGTGMTYSINGSTYTNTSGTFTGVTVGTYNVSAKNASGCTSPATSVTLNANPLPAVPTVTLTQPACGSTTGTIAVTSPTGTGMTYSINGTTYTNTSGIFVSVASGTYTVTARNSAGCTSSGSSAVINTQPATPTTPTITLNGNILHSNAAYGNQWYNESGVISGATDQDYTPTSGGNYYVIVNNGVCSSDPSNTIKVVLTGIEQFDFSKIINFYPNPTDGKVTLSIKGENPGKITIEILNIQGQSMKTEKMEKFENQTEINLEGLPKGIYFVKITISGNSVIRTIILQ